VLTAAADALGVTGEVSVLLTDNATIRELNRTWRGEDRPTDVLSFSQREGEGPPGEDPAGASLLGDIVVSVEQARLQAEAYGHSLRREVAFLTVHGFLHLVGYDHQTPEDEAEMMSRTEAILGPLGLGRD
jgi:probable rRNA maturation factor